LFRLWSSVLFPLGHRWLSSKGSGLHRASAETRTGPDTNVPPPGSIGGCWVCGTSTMRPKTTRWPASWPRLQYRSSGRRRRRGTSGSSSSSPKLRFIRRVPHRRFFLNYSMNHTKFYLCVYEFESYSLNPNPTPFARCNPDAAGWRSPSRRRRPSGGFCAQGRPKGHVHFVTPIPHGMRATKALLHAKGWMADLSD